LAKDHAEEKPGLRKLSARFDNYFKHQVRIIMLYNLNYLLTDAQKKKMAIAAVNVYSLETIRGALQSAHRLGLPVILAFSPRYLDNMTYRQFVWVAKSCAVDLDVPYALHLDHCNKLGQIAKAMEAGFTSVMFDGSALPFVQNIDLTRKVVELAHPRGISVEGELGAIRTGRFSSEDSGESERYTSPEHASEFVRRTGVDALAVSIGTVHGLYTGEQKIRIDLLKKIQEAVSVPLVLHGGSGTKEDLLRETVANGICKVNINTEISLNTVAKTATAIARNPDIHLAALLLQQVAFVSEIIEKYMRLLSAE
jgi:fructose-bisphosphate aldolase class II